MNPSTRHRCALTSLLLAAALSACASRSPESSTARIDRLLATTPLIDGHDDLLIHYLLEDGKSLATIDAYDIGTQSAGQVDLPRLKAGRVGASIFTVGINDPKQPEASIQASTGLLRALAAKHPTQLEVATDSTGLLRAFKAGRVAALMGLEGGDQIGGSLDVLRASHAAGVRAMTLTWEYSNEIGDSNADAPMHDGLSPFGADVVREMNRLGMLVDLSHAADTTAFDVLALTTAPVILSHSSARALCPIPRNAPDSLLKAVAANGGIVMVGFVPYHTTPANHDWYQRGEAV